MRLTLAILAVAVAVAACGGLPGDKNKEKDSDDVSGPGVHGSGGNKSAPQSSGIMVLLEGDTLPSCDASIIGRTYYVLSEQLFRFCDDDGNWTVVDLIGGSGAQGPKGDKGDPGSVTFANYDGNDELIAYPMPGGGRFYLPAERVYAGILVSTGEVTGADACRYESMDCSGSCYSPVTDTFRTPIFETLLHGDGGALFKVAAGASASTRTVRSHYDFLDGCQAGNVTGSVILADPFTFMELDPPFALPITTRVVE